MDSVIIHKQKSNKSKKSSFSDVNADVRIARRTSINLEDNRLKSVIQQKQIETLQRFQPAKAFQKKAQNNTGLPDNLKSGIENLSSQSMDDVQVHYNSAQPAQLNAHAFAQGNQIHSASGQEKHLSHEAWHVVQQKQGRVKPAMQMKGRVNVNDDKGLEKEPDVMGAAAISLKYNPLATRIFRNSTMGAGYPAQLTPAEELLGKHRAAHGELPEDDVHALIGSDNEGANLIAPEL